MRTVPERVVVVSDLHMAPPGPLDSFHAGHALADLVASLGGPGAVPAERTHLIMNGDTFDFLQIDERPPKLDAAGVAALVERVVTEVGAADWGARLYAALASFTERGGQWRIIPGNHDPELHHPDAAALIARTTGADPARTAVHDTTQPWTAGVGAREVVIGHGNRSDPFNDIDPAAWRSALAAGDEAPPLPPGSRLVLDTVNAFKRAGHGFVDALKPEMPGVLLLLLYIDRRLALAHLPGVAGHGAAALAGAVRRAIRGGQSLTPTSASSAEPIDLVAHALEASLSPEEALAADDLARDFEAWLERAPSPLSLDPGAADHDGVSAWLLRKIVRQLSYDHSFFDPAALGAVDRAVIGDHLPEGGPARVVVAGHTHAARHRVLTGGRVYINTGTWSDLMRLPGPDDHLPGWIDQLVTGRVPREQRLHYADITPADARLRPVESRAASSS